MSRRHKYQEIRDYIQRDAEEMWRKIDVRLLANSLRFSCSDDCTLAYIDIISCTKKIEQWEERPVLPLSLLAQGDGSFYHPFKINPNDLLLQLVCAGLDSDALEEFQMYIHLLNMQLRTVKLNNPLPNRSQMEFLEMRKLLGKFNDELLNRANYQVTLALFQAQMCVLEGKYVENILSAHLNSGLIDDYSDQLQRGELKRLYSFRLGLIFTDYKPKKALSQSDPPQSVSRSLHYEANLTGLDALPGLKSASDPMDSAPFWECSLRGLLLVPGMWNQHLVLFILSLLVLMDITIKLLLLVDFYGSRNVFGFVMFGCVMPGVNIITPILGVLMLPLPQLTVIYVSFQLVCCSSTVMTSLYLVEKQTDWFWMGFLLSQICVKLASIRFAAMYKANEESAFPIERRNKRQVTPMRSKH